MNLIIELIGPILGITSAVITLVAFFKQKIKNNISLLITSLFFASVIIFVWDSNKEKQFDLYLLEEKQRYDALIVSEREKYIVNDAKVVSESIDLYGVQDYGKYLAQLGTIVGFYKRNIDHYESEYKSLSKQYDQWQQFFENKRSKGQIIYSSDYGALKGLVKSNVDYISKLAESRKGA